MRYLGSKLRLFKYIGPIIQKYIDDNNIRLYVEPFVGGANVIDKIKCERRIGIDGNPDLIQMWQALQNGWKPPKDVSEEEYKLLKEEYKRESHAPNALSGFVGIACAFSGSWFAGYSKAEGRNRCKETRNSILKQMESMKDVVFEYLDYANCSYIVDQKAVVYCDIPYEGISLYPGSNFEFNHNEFWGWARAMSNKGHIVLVSEYKAPSDCTELLWEQQVLVNAHQVSQKKAVEKLFIVRP